MIQIRHEIKRMGCACLGPVCRDYRFCFPTHFRVTIVFPSHYHMSLCGSSSAKPSFGRGRPVRDSHPLRLLAHSSCPMTDPTQGSRLRRRSMWFVEFSSPFLGICHDDTRNCRKDLTLKRIHAWFLHPSLVRLAPLFSPGRDRITGLVLSSEPTVFENYVYDLYVDDQVVELSLWDTAGTQNTSVHFPAKVTFNLLFCLSIL
jgi:hypothetical protein